MLEHYFIKPATVDRIRANVACAYIEHYVSWLHARGIQLAPQHLGMRHHQSVVGL